MFDPAWGDAAGVGLDDAGRELVVKAARWVTEPLSGVRAGTGEQLDRHCAATVEILAGIGVDAATRASALIAVMPEAPDGTAGARHDSLRREFGPEVVSLVQGTSALLRLGERAGQSSDSAASRSEEHTSELQSLMRISYAVF